MHYCGGGLRTELGGGIESTALLPGQSSIHVCNGLASDPDY